MAESRTCAKLACMRFGIALIALSLVISACGAGESDASSADQLVGRWAHYDVVAYEGDGLKSLIISYGFNDFSVDEGVLTDQASFCYSEQRTDQPIESALNETATQAIKPPPTAMTVTEVEGVVSISRPASPTALGIVLDDPANESLPDDPNDPRIIDADGDGNPGVTVNLQVNDTTISGELFIARREIFSYDADLVNPDRIEGAVVDSSEQLVIGASNPLFASSPAQWAQHPDPAKSPVILIRVDDTWDCDTLAAQRNELFPPTPDVDW